VVCPPTGDRVLDRNGSALTQCVAWRVEARLLAKHTLVVALEKESAIVSEYSWFQDEHPGKIGGNHVHRKTGSCSTFSKYLP
jgi:hypothetical protein